MMNYIIFHINFVGPMKIISKSFQDPDNWANYYTSIVSKIMNTLK